MENFVTSGNASIGVNLGVHRLGQNTQKPIAQSAADETLLAAEMNAEALSDVVPSLRDRSIDVYPDPSDASVDRKARRPNSGARNSPRETMLPTTAREAIVPHAESDARSAPEYMHLWAAIERHFTQTTSQSAVLNELIGSTPPFVLGITSAVVGEGKTTVAMNLAESAARNTWYRVCLVDLGLDGDEISLRHGIDSDGTGVIGLLEQSESGHFNSQSLPTFHLEDRSGLTVLPAGKRPANAARVARSPHLVRLIECMREKFDLIIVDLPAVSTDNALPIVAAMDGIVVVARAGATPADVVGDAVGKIGREAVIGVVLNRVKFSGPSWMKRLLSKW